MQPLSHRIAAYRAALGSRRAADPIGFRVEALLVAVLFGLVLRLLFGDDPWTGGIAERQAEGKDVRPVDYARTYGWWAALVNALGVVALLATRRAWFTRGDVHECRSVAPVGPLPRWLIAGTTAAVLVAGALALPRMTHSFWDDELFALEHAIDGSYRTQRDGSLEFDRARFRDTLWYFYRAANHVPQSVLSRWSADTWRVLSQPELRFASEPAVRLPSLVAGLLAIVVIATLLARLGRPGAGLIAAWLFALHPWMLRYSSEARGYALLVLLVSTLALLLLRALHRGTWARWLAYGVVQFGVLWTFSGAFFVLVVSNTIGGLWLWQRTRGTPDAAQQLPRFLIANLGSGMLWLQIMGPNVPQLFIFITDHAAAGLDFGRALKDLGGHLWIGTPWSLGDGTGRFVELRELWAAWPRLTPFAAGATGLLVLLGAYRLARLGAAGAITVTLLALPGIITLCVYWARGSYVYMWYFMFMLPGFVVLLAMGSSPPRHLGRAGVAAATLGLLAYFASFVVLGDPQRDALRAGPLQPVRESVELTRAERDPFADTNQRIVTASFQTPPSYYDPLVRLVSKESELRALMAEADAADTALFVNYGRPRLAARRAPDLISLLEQGTHFELVDELVGSSPRGVRRVYRYLGSERPCSPRC